MRSRAWAVLVAGGLALNASGGRAQEGGVAPVPVPSEPDVGAVPAPMASDPAGGPCLADAPEHPVRSWLADHCWKKAAPDCDLCPKGHDWRGWLTYHQEARGFCAPAPCCPPPLYTFFLNPCCASGPPTPAPCCKEARAPWFDGHHLKPLLFWRHPEKVPAACPGDHAVGQLAVAAPPAPPHP